MGGDSSWIGPAIGAGAGLLGNYLDGGDQTVTQTQELPPWASDAMQYNIGMGQQLANRPYIPYIGDRFAGFNPMQQSAFGSYDVFGNMGLPALGGSFNALTDLTGAGMMGGAYGGLMNFANNLGGMAPDSVSAGQVNPMFASYTGADAQLANRGSIRDVMGGSFLDMDINQYMNPYTQSVIQNTTDEMNRGRQIQLQQGGAAANAAGAFGGSRHGVSDSLTNAEFFRNQGNMVNQMNAQAYNAATGLMGQDLGRALQANLANQGVDQAIASLNAQLGTGVNQFNAGQANNISLQNAQMGNQVGLQNAANQLTAGLANQQAQQNFNSLYGGLGLSALQSAGGLGSNLANFTQTQGMNLMNFGQNALGSQLAAGNQQQQFGQMQLDDFYSRWLEARDWYPNQFQYALAPLSGFSPGSTTSYPVFGPSMMQSALGGASLGAGLYGGGGKAGGAPQGYGGLGASAGGGYGLGVGV